MSRELRKVPANWEHPRDDQGEFIPLLGGSFKKEAAEWDEAAKQWAGGFCRNFKDEWRPKKADETGTYEEWEGPRHEEHEYMPDWPEAERTHYQMYETTTDGIPISPVMETPEALAHWLADNGASASADQTASYDHWLAMIKKGRSPTFVTEPGKSLVSGVEFVSKEEE